MTRSPAREQVRPSEAREHHRIHQSRPWAALGIVSLIVLLMAAVILTSGGDSRVIRISALVVLDMFVVIAGILLYVCWRLTGTALIGWVALVPLTLGLSELPFLLLALADPSVMLAPGAEPGEVASAAMGVVLYSLAVRRVEFRATGPLTLGIIAASLLALFRVLSGRLPALPLGWVDGTATSQRLVLLGLVLIGAVILMRCTDAPLHLRVALAVGGVGVGVMSVVDDVTTPDHGLFPAVVAGFAAIVLAERFFSASLRLTIDTIQSRLAEQADLARRSARARISDEANVAVLDAVRSTVGPLARASTALRGESAAADRGELRDLQEAMQREFGRVNRLLRAAPMSRPGPRKDRFKGH